MRTTVQSVRNITARLLDAMTGKRWLAYSTDSSRVYQFDIDFYCSEFRLTRICLVISLCLNIIYREMGRNLPVCEDVVQVVFTLRSDGWSHSQIGVHFGKSKSWAKYVLAAYSEESLSPKVVQKRGRKRKTDNVEDMIIVGMGQHLFKESYEKLTAVINFQRTDKFGGEQRSRRMGKVLVTACGSSRIPCSEYQHRAVIFLTDRR